MVQHNVQIFPCSELHFERQDCGQEPSCYQDSEYHSLQHSSSSGLSRKVARGAANRLRACALLLTRLFGGFNWGRSYFYSVSPEQSCEWDISQRRQKEKKGGNKQLLLCNAQPKCNLQLSVTPRGAGAPPERWHSASMAAGCQMAPISCLPHSTPPPRSLCMKSTNYVKKHPGTTSPAINNCSF